LCAQLDRDTFPRNDGCMRGSRWSEVTCLTAAPRPRRSTTASATGQRSWGLPLERTGGAARISGLGRFGNAAQAQGHRSPCSPNWATRD